MLERASADVTLRPGDLIGSGTVGTGCLLEVREQTLGRYLEPGDEVVLAIERLGQLSTPVVGRRSAT
jgi:fumarylacetoacetate (FAA) hydrolase